MVGLLTFNSGKRFDPGGSLNASKRETASGGVRIDIVSMSWGLLFMFLIFVAPLGAQVKIGWIDSNRIIEEFEESRSARQRLDDEARRIEAEFQNMVAQRDSMAGAYERQRFIMSDQRRAEREREIQDLELRIRQFQVTKLGPEGEIYRRQREIVGPVLDRINTAIMKIGENGGYDYIFDAVAGNILFAKPEHDLTTTVLQELRRGGGE